MGKTIAGRWRSLASAEKTFVILFLITLPFIQPRVRDDGIGYYAYARSILIDHNLQFRGDWKDHPQVMPRWVEKNSHGFITGIGHYTKTGHVYNYFPIGPAVLWTPFLAVTHLGVLTARAFGSQIPADGFSQPYLLAMGFGTALYGFLGLWISFRLARSYYQELWALLAALGIWFGTSLPVYMYVDTAWAHAHAAFTTSLFLWYWHRTREHRTTRQWLVWGLVTGLMLEVYFASFVFLIVPLVDCFSTFRNARHDEPKTDRSIWRPVPLMLAYGAGALIAMLPMFITRQIVFGNPLGLSPYASNTWNWGSPALWNVLFSSNNGALVWTPILIPAVIGLFLFARRIPSVGGPLLAVAAAHYYLIASLPWWHGTISFGNRYFVSLTPLFVIGLAAAFSEFARLWSSWSARHNAQGALRRVATVSAVLVFWNLGLVFQWSDGLLPNSHFDEVLYNQFRVVPGELLHALESRFAGAPKSADLAGQ